MVGEHSCCHSAQMRSSSGGERRCTLAPPLGLEFGCKDTFAAAEILCFQSLFDYIIIHSGWKSKRLQTCWLVTDAFSVKILATFGCSSVCASLTLNGIRTCGGKEATSGDTEVLHTRT